MNITGILLAAGSGTRFGGGKLLHPLPDGTPIGIASLRNLRLALPDIRAIVRKGDERMRKSLEAEQIPVTIGKESHLGMGYSLSSAVAAAKNSDGWVIALADMPFLMPSTISAVARAIAKSGRIAVPSYKGTRGHPVGFGKRYLRELLALEGDAGARAVIERHPGDIEIIERNDPGILRDIDTRADL